jgi:hypothetical protein
MSGAIPPLPQYASWRGAYLKHRDNFTFSQLPPYIIHTHLSFTNGQYKNQLSEMSQAPTADSLSPYTLL